MIDVNIHDLGANKMNFTFCLPEFSEAGVLEGVRPYLMSRELDAVEEEDCKGKIFGGGFRIVGTFDYCPAKKFYSAAGYDLDSKQWVGCGEFGDLNAARDAVALYDEWRIEDENEEVVLKS